MCIRDSPYTDMIGEFIKLAKKLNKRVLYDIDDLVIDTRSVSYTHLDVYKRQGMGRYLVYEYYWT